MVEISERYGRIADGFGARLAGVSSGDWTVPTPCSEWDVRALVVHVIATHGRVFSTVSGLPPPEVDSHGDLMTQWSAARSTVGAALSDPEQAATMVGGMFGDQPFETLVSRLLCADTLFHTWDLARATRQDDRLDPEGVAKALEFLQPIDEAIRRPGGFAAKITPPSGSDLQTQLLCFGGRSAR